MAFRSKTTGRFIQTPWAGMNVNISDYSLTEPMTIPLSSTAIRKAYFNPLERRLEISFTDGTVYEYYSVELDTFLGLIRASSVGKYFNYQIRNNYEYSGG